MAVFTASPLAEGKPTRENPMGRFLQWFDDAKGVCSLEQAQTMCLSTVDLDGRPDGRLVLLKGADEKGFVFYTNLESPKAVSLRALAQAALTFDWTQLQRQVRVQGEVERVSDAEADAYFASRPHASRLGAWASRQSQDLPSRAELYREVMKYGLQFAGRSMPRPPWWGGFRVKPSKVEFWEKRPFRLHRRQEFVRGEGGDWRMRELFP